MKVRIKKLHPKAVIPTYAHATDACFDLYAATMDTDGHGNTVYGTGLAFEIPDGYYLQLQPRSSNTKKNLVLLNSPGIVDSGYRGEVTFKYRSIGPMESKGDHCTFYSVGDRIGQGVILPCPKIEFELSETVSDSDRGIGGYGSTGV